MLRQREPIVTSIASLASTTGSQAEGIGEADHATTLLTTGTFTSERSTSETLPAGSLSAAHDARAA